MSYNREHRVTLSLIIKTIYKIQLSSLPLVLQSPYTNKLTGEQNHFYASRGKKFNLENS